MAHENDDDDDEIEQHLIERITHAIDNQGDHQQNLLTKYFTSFEAEFRELITTLKPKTSPYVTDDWLSVRRENLYSLNNLLTEWQITKNQSSFSPKEIYNSCENIKNSLKKMKKELHGEETSSRGDIGRYFGHYHQEPNHPIFPRNKKEVYRWSSRHAPRKVHGFEHRVMAMERDLVMRNIDASFKVFGVVGVAGIGKTTLCQAIFGRKLVTEYFSPRIWVCLSKQPSGIQDYRKDIVVRILKCLGVEDEVINDAGKDDAHELRRLILLLRLQLTGKRYLIVLDDAWNDDKFFMNLTQKEELDENWGEELAYGLPKGCNGAVISSSRSDALLKKMFGKDVNLQYLKPHSKEIIDEIFKDTVIGYDEDEREFPQHLTDLKKEILEKCDGVPLAAKLLAKIAREQLKVKPKPAPPPPRASEVQEIRRSPAALRLKDGGDAGGRVQDGEHKGGFRP